MKKYIILIGVLAVFLTAILIWPQDVVEDEIVVNDVNIEFIQTENTNMAQEELIIQDVLLDVPFTSQAPYGDWADARYQDACEEACVLMTMKWVNNKTVLNKEEANQEMIFLSDWQHENYGSYVDTSAQDTAQRLLGEYYGCQNYQVKSISIPQEIIEELLQGNLVIAPTNGRTLANPNFTAPGPERHMVVITGYNLATEQFVTNDPGTRNGEDWMYHQDHLFRAIRDYPTGDHLQINSVEKNIIVIFK